MFNYTVKGRYHTCAGTYIGAGWVLSSAHCFRKNRESPIDAVSKIPTYFGDFYWHPDETQNEEFILKPIAAFAHESADRRADLVLLKYDKNKISQRISEGGGKAQSGKYICRF